LDDPPTVNLSVYKCGREVMMTKAAKAQSAASYGNMHPSTVLFLGAEHFNGMLFNFQWPLDLAAST
jgi:hypothetical protein